LGETDKFMKEVVTLCRSNGISARKRYSIACVHLDGFGCQAKAQKIDRLYGKKFHLVIVRQLQVMGYLQAQILHRSRLRNHLLTNDINKPSGEKQNDKTIH